MKTIITEKATSPLVGIKNAFQYKELIWLLAYRDIKSRYAHTTIGILWSIISPIIVVAILSTVFSTIVRIEIKEVPYPLFLLVGMTGWAFFANAVNASTTAILSNQNMIQKVHFPKIVIPLSSLIVNCIDFAVYLVLIFLLMVFYNVDFTTNLFFLPIFILLTFVVSLIAIIWLSALVVRFRDLLPIVGFALYLLFYLTPVFYPIYFVPKEYQLIYFINPLVVIIEGFRWCLWGGLFPNLYAWSSLTIYLLSIVPAWRYFHKIEQQMADIL